MKLDKNTYGNQPAAEYLVALLNEHLDRDSPGIKATIREIGTHLTGFCAIMNELEASAEEGLLSYRSLALLCANIRQNLDQWMPNIRVNDVRLNNLTRNILVGMVKALLRRLTELSHAMQRQKSVQSMIDRKKFDPGITVMDGCGRRLYSAGRRVQLTLDDVPSDRDETIFRLRQKNAKIKEQKGIR